MTEFEIRQKAEERRREYRKTAEAKERAANVLDFLSFGAFIGGCWMTCVWHRSGSWADALATVAIIGLLFLMTRAADALREEVTIYKVGEAIITGIRQAQELQKEVEKE